MQARGSARFTFKLGGSRFALAPREAVRLPIMSPGVRRQARR
jgi:hypothetical protein